MADPKGSFVARVDALIDQLDLAPHPEGGFFREIFRSDSSVQPADSRSERSALTTIYFLLARGQHSRWHRVASDEVWHFYEGDPLELHWVGPDGRVGASSLSADPGHERVVVIPAGYWQAARPSGEFALVGCTVGPGFDFEDFEMMEEPGRLPSELADLADLPPGLA